MADIFAKNVARVPAVGRALALAIQATAFVFTRSGIGKRVSESSANAFPLAYFLVAEKPA